MFATSLLEKPSLDLLYLCGIIEHEMGWIKGKKQTPDHVFKRQEAMASIRLSADYREKMRQAALKRSPTSPEGRESIRQSKLGNKYWVGRKHSPETREKIRQAHLGKPKSAEHREAMRGRSFSLETRERMRQGSRKRWSRPEEREKTRQARLRQCFPRTMTSIERVLFDEFKKRRLRFEMHRTMFGRWQPDFVFESARLVIQADGDYWHSLPEVRGRDISFAETASVEGWSVWRFGEQEIHMHAPACARAVARFVRDHPSCP